MTLGQPEYDHRRFAQYKPASNQSADIIQALTSLVTTIAVIVGISIGWQHFGPNRSNSHLVLPLTAPRFDQLRANESTWTFTYLNPGEERLTLTARSATPGGQVDGVYDQLTDGAPAYSCGVGPAIREGLFRAVIDHAGALFATTVSLPKQYSRPESFSYRPLFLFEMPGPGERERYVLAFGGNASDSAMSPEVEAVQRAVTKLEGYLKAHGDHPNSTVETTVRGPVAQGNMSGSPAAGGTSMGNVGK
ncbi:MAG: hypothetical protein ABI743_09320 [bacterium]